MTGTADTEALEFQNIYNLRVVVIPTNLPMMRKDLNDLIYRTEKEKIDAIVSYIKKYNKDGNPVLSSASCRALSNSIMFSEDTFGNFVPKMA